MAVHRGATRPVATLPLHVLDNYSVAATSLPRPVQDADRGVIYEFATHTLYCGVRRALSAVGSRSSGCGVDRAEYRKFPERRSRWHFVNPLAKLGTPTYGLTMGNNIFELYDGALLFLASVVEADRTGQQFSSHIEPDAFVADSADMPSDDVLVAAASAWFPQSAA